MSRYLDIAVAHERCHGELVGLAVEGDKYHRIRTSPFDIGSSVSADDKDAFDVFPAEGVLGTGTLTGRDKVHLVYERQRGAGIDAEKYEEDAQEAEQDAADYLPDKGLPVLFLDLDDRLMDRRLRNVRLSCGLLFLFQLLFRRTRALIRRRIIAS